MREGPWAMTMLAAAAASIAAGVIGCGSSRGLERGRADATIAAPPAPAVLGGDNGLEVGWWVVRPGARLGALLADFEELPVAVDRAQLDVWKANGLRVIAVPVGALDPLRESMSLSGAIQRQWLGQAPLWTEAIKGPQVGHEFVLATDAARLALPPGRLRLLARCWTTPTPPPDAGEPAAAKLTIELLPQHQEMMGARTIDPFGGPVQGSLSPQREGLLFRRLMLTIEARAGVAYLLVPDEPAADWAAEQRAMNEPPPEPEETGVRTPGLGEVARGLGEGSKPGAERRGGGATEVPAGPPGPRIPTLGEAMLTGFDIRLGKPGGARAVVILLPRVPERFNLLPR